MQKESGSPQVRFSARDKYGGCPDIRFASTGFFRLEKAGRWWLVTPEGSAFLSFGINHVGLGMLQRKENRDYWAGEFGLEADADPSALLPHFRRKVRDDLNAFGFNTLGCHSGTEPYDPGFAPYVHALRFVDINHSVAHVEADFLDVFSPDFETHCDGKARRDAASRKDDPYLIGYSFTDCPIFTDLDAASRGVRVYGAPRNATPTWPRVLRNLGPDAPGKRAYVDCVREIYAGDIRAFNQVYATPFDTFDALYSARDWRPVVDPRNSHETRDSANFLEQVVDRYYTVAVGAIRRHDPNHLVFGDKLNGNTGVPDGIVALTGRHVDLIFYQTYGYYGMQKPIIDRWSEITGRPLFNGDASYSVPNEMMPHPLGPHCADQEDRAQVSLEFAHRAFSRPDFVGWNYCGWIDGWKTHPRQEIRQHSGLQDPFGNRYRPMVDALSGFSAEMYDIATANNPS